MFYYNIVCLLIKEEIRVSQLYNLGRHWQEKLIICTSIEANVSALLAPMNEKLETMEKDFQRMKEKM